MEPGHEDREYVKISQMVGIATSSLNGARS